MNFKNFHLVVIVTSERKLKKVLKTLEKVSTVEYEEMEDVFRESGENLKIGKEAKNNHSAAKKL